jgi:hypothetical protein
MRNIVVHFRRPSIMTLLAQLDWVRKIKCVYRYTGTRLLKEELRLQANISVAPVEAN